MRRPVRSLLALLATATTVAAAQADVWMVKGSGTLGCRTREDFAAHEDGRTKPPVAPPSGAKSACVALYAGERLLEQAEIGVGFNEYMRVERHDGSILFAPISELVADPGTGSVTDNRGD